MSSSGLIYAVIVGAWAAYLVPMWLRRQDELNEARPTERFSTAIRLLSGRSAMERRYARELRQRGSGDPAPDADPDAPTEFLGDPAQGVDVRDLAVPRQHPTGAGAQRRGEREEPRPEEARPERAEVPHPAEPAHEAPRPEERRGSGRGGDERSGGARQGDARRREDRSAAAAERARRARRSAVLARRRRTTVVLFLAFTLGAVVAAVGGLGFLWAPAAPAVLLSAYIMHLRAQERRRFAFVMDRRRAEAAAQRLRERQPRRQPAAAEPEDEPEPHPAPEPEPVVSPQEADRRALVEQTDHAEWVDQQRERGPERGDSWEPVPVPLPTYVTAPVAPRATGSIDLGAPDTWSSARSSTADPTVPAPPAPRRRMSTGSGRTPLFDQYADDDRPRAANE
ncbi:gephyrin-like molybdotransferase receptor GlpR [Streptomyces sp. NPDC005878]|uniref:divisome protein SepX/GlpR n=2 Tax=unclassified Streptomyces TaxID=2593676 RepID=UPI00340BD945